MGGMFLRLSLLSILLLIGSARADSVESERLRKFDLALKTLGVPPEAAPDFSDFPVAGSVSTRDALSLANVIDPDGGLRRYLGITPSRIELFPSFRLPNEPAPRPDYELLTGAPENRDSPELLGRLERISRRVIGSGTNPLSGLRVTIDPGHMGSRFWNEIDGKYVNFSGKTVAEGELTLWTAKLLATELERLGAEVTLTRTDLEPVTSYTWDNFDPSERLADYYYKSLDDWMGKYLALSDADLVRQLPNAPEVRKMETVGQRGNLFLQEDLLARAKIVEAARPDVFIDLHFDSQKTDELQSDRNDVSVYVPGGVRKNETGPRSDRAYALKHLVEVRRWKQSARMAKLLVDAVARNLALPTLKDSSRIPSMVKVADGVFARNLFQTKRATSSLVAYFESLHYDHVREFSRLTKLDGVGSYRGKSFRYPTRLTGIAHGIRDGLLSYFREFTPD